MLRITKLAERIPEVMKGPPAGDEGGQEMKEPAETGVVPYRQYKDRVFRMVFKGKKEFLELYNAVNGTSYDRPEDLMVTTLENAIYMSYKNDVSFLVYDQLALYEHQSTRNPNVPLRNLFYVSNLYSEMTRKENLYGTRLISIPEPRFIVFYNGKDPIPEKMELKLSDAYGKPGREEGPALELRVQVLNINPGYNQALMQNCRTLREYMHFVCRVREYAARLPLAQAVERAVQECIAEGVLAEFLRENRSEVISVSIFEYDQEQHMRLEREAARSDGIAEGKVEGKAEAKAEDVIELLEDIEPVPIALRTRIMSERNLILLKKWHKLSARAASLSQFMREMDQ